jgi:molybdate transport system substrate-binding protein
MRTRVSVVLALLLVAPMVACGSNSEEASAPAGTASPQAAAATTALSPTPSASGEITVFAAASLTDAFNEMGTEFSKANPRATVKFNFAASTALRTQLEQGARADLFASADQIQMDNARKAGVIDGEDRLFVKNKLVMIYPAGNPGKVSALKDLANPNLKVVLTDKNVPIGAYARTALEKMSADPGFGAGFGQKVLANLKSEEANVRAVVTKVQLGEADAAIVYASDVTPAVAKDIHSVIMPDQFNTIATYPIAVVKDARNKAGAQAFIQFVRSSAGQAILKQWNFIVDADTGVAWAPSSRPIALLRAMARPAVPGPMLSMTTKRSRDER